MDTLEQELLDKLNNVFSFGFKVKYQELKGSPDFLEVFKFLFNVRMQKFTEREEKN